MKHLSILITTAFLALGLAPASALGAAEEGDAGELPASAQDLSTEVVGSISGEFASAGDVDLYRVCLAAGGSFSATTVNGTDVDTQLFLFDAAGLGVYADDNDGTSTQSTLPAGHPLTPTTRGVYLLGISTSDRDPQSLGGAIFENVAELVGATGRGAGEPLASWTGRGRSVGDYTVGLTGTSVCGDTVPPVVDLRSPADGTTVAQGTPLVVDFSCTDEGGSGLASCEGSVPDGASLDTSSLGTRTVTVTARDGEGNETVASASVEVVDELAPSIDIRSPWEGVVLSLGSVVGADYECRDEAGGSGLATCSGDVPDGAPLDTSSVGVHTFTVTATDAAGNSASSTVAYEVALVWDFRFLWPAAEFPAVRRWSAGRAVPIRFSLGGPRGLDVLADGHPQVAEVRCGAGEQPQSGDAARSPWWRKGLRYRPRRDRYVFWWQTERTWAGGCRQLLLKLDDGSLHRAEFRFVRRPWWFWFGW